MSAKKLNFVWAMSLMIIGVAAMILLSGMIGIVLPDVVIRIAGITALVTLPVLAFTSVKKMAKQG